jgi:hypothetical protein
MKPPLLQDLVFQLDDEFSCCLFHVKLEVRTICYEIVGKWIVKVTRARDEAWPS